MQTYDVSKLSDYRYIYFPKFVIENRYTNEKKNVELSVLALKKEKHSLFMCIMTVCTYVLVIYHIIFMPFIFSHLC